MRVSLPSAAADRAEQNSRKRIDASDAGAARINGYSLSTRPIVFDPTPANAADFRAKFAAALGATSPQKSFQISVDGAPSVVVTIPDDFTDAVAFPGIAARC